MAATWLTPDSPIAVVVRRPTVTVESSASIGETADVMREANVSAVLVGDTGAIVTERDLTVALARRLGPDAPVAEIGSLEPLRVPARTSVVDAARTMCEQHVRHLVVDLPGEPDGIVSLRDVVATLITASEPLAWTMALRHVGVVTSELWLG